MKSSLIVFLLSLMLFCTCNLIRTNKQNCNCYPVNRSKAPKIELYSQLKWHDEFNKPVLDTTKWRFEKNNLFKEAHGEKQVFTTDYANILLENGILKILAIKNDSLFTSSCLSTRDKFNFGNGRIDIRAKLPFGKGFLSTFNLINPQGRENIDIVNHTGRYRVGGAIRFTNDAGEHRSEGDSHFKNNGFGYSSAFHTFTLIKEKNKIWWFVDNQLFFMIDSTVSVPFSYNFNNELYLMLNLSIGGVWAGEPDKLTCFPQGIEIDYIRYYVQPNRKSGDPTSPKTKIKLSDYQKIFWSDEFDHKQIDTNTWSYDVGDFWQNNEIQAYTNDSTNSYIRYGNLVLSAIKSPSHVKTVKDYTSARLITKGKMDLKYGRVDIRAKMPFGQGIWPAIWMLPTEGKFGGWPKSGEIDILEVIGDEMNIVNKACHFGADGERHSRGRPYDARVDLSKDFHLYSLIKEKDDLWWFFDSIPMMHVSKELLAPHHYPFNEEFYLILNIAIGGNWPGYPDSTTVFPQTMEVDYVRVYKKSNY